ncbi:gibberellin 20 oxidase 2-like [Olea europaea subsp. europaea]|uniref:Gibberellin 20 oxidase 2-like n=1 Tax=Olea europaea subsp. europaea TaxID=158383 RepID=A0A8S0T4M4_OLEEU|nr:gibberellin 20 oxidase 2-like [Olea europaea subsp. europaea]
MESNASTLVFHTQSSIKKEDIEKGPPAFVFDTSVLQKQEDLPTQFLWPHEDLTCITQDELTDPPVDLKGFFNGDEEAISFAALQIQAACSNHGFFQVINHGVDSTLIRAAHKHMNAFFDLPMSRKFAIKRNPGSVFGYSGAHAHRYSSKLPWKETFSFGYSHDNSLEPDVMNYFKSVLGNDFEDAGLVYQKYCEAMRDLSLWQVIRPCPDAFAVNISDTFMALCNGRYKSCLHRAVVNKEKVRKSLVYFVSPKEDNSVLFSPIYINGILANY